MKESKNDEIKNYNKKYYQNNKNIYNEDFYSKESKKKSYTYDKNNKSLINKNRIGKFNILSTKTNYKNNILNMLTPNKKIIKTSTSCNKKTNNSNRNYFSEIVNQMKNNYNNSLNKNKHKSLNTKKRKIKLTLSDIEQDNINNIHTKYNLIFYEKNKIISNLKNELNYYKNILGNANQIQTNNNTIETNNQISLMANRNKDNKREKIKNIFSQTNKNKNNIVKYKFNKYNNLQTFMGKINNNVNCNNSEGTKDSIPSFNNEHDKNGQNANLFENYTNNYNIKLLSNNDLSLNKEKNYNSSSNIFNRNNYNLLIKKDDKLKLKTKNNELTFESKYNYKNIDINDNKTLKTSKSIFNSFNHLNSSNRSNYKLDNNETSTYNNKDISNKKIFNRILKNQKFCFNNISSPSYLLNHFENKDLIDYNVFGILKKQKNDSSIDLEYIDNLECLKQRMSKLIDNLFSYIDFKKEKAH
jgi:hypothetical protein